MLVERFVGLLEDGWGEVFARSESHNRAIQHALALPACLGKRTVSRAICALGRSQGCDWSADYKLYSRSPWDADDLFDPVIRTYLDSFPSGPIVAALDDTKLARTGRHVPGTMWYRDPLSPPFRANLMWATRWLQASLIFPHHRESDLPARGIPVRFIPAPAVRKPGSKATDEDRAAYRLAVRQKNLSTQGHAMLAGLRERFDSLGASHRDIIAAGDGSFCNREFFRNPIERVILLARTRKDARLCRPASPGSRCIYDPNRFTPEQVRADEAVPYRATRLYIGGAWREVCYKELSNLLWRRGAATSPVRLLVLAPQPYKLSPHARTFYRQPAYLLTNNLTLPAAILLQAYVDRWQIEVNHRDEKSLWGVGDAQVWSEQSAARHPTFAVASYSMLLLAGLLEFGPGRTTDYHPLPAWRKRAKRPSALDLLTRLRLDIETSVSSPIFATISQKLTRAAYT
jgi:hypothetical protein